MIKILMAAAVAATVATQMAIASDDTYLLCSGTIYGIMPHHDPEKSKEIAMHVSHDRVSFSGDYHF